MPPACPSAPSGSASRPSAGPATSTSATPATSGDSDVAAMERHAHEVLDAACEAGVRYFDAARSYGRGEEFLASWLGAPRPRRAAT